MTQVFTQFISSLIEENILESTDEEITNNINKNGYPTSEDIEQVREMIHLTIASSRKSRLQDNIKKFTSSQRISSVSITEKLKKSADEMLTDIVKAMTTKQDNMPEGLLIAFRSQTGKPSDEDIESYWNDLVDLGLIDSKDK